MDDGQVQQAFIEILEEQLIQYAEELDVMGMFLGRMGARIMGLLEDGDDDVGG